MHATEQSIKMPLEQGVTQPLHLFVPFQVGIPESDDDTIQQIFSFFPFVWDMTDETHIFVVLFIMFELYI